MSTDHIESESSPIFSFLTACAQQENVDMHSEMTCSDVATMAPKRKVAVELSFDDSNHKRQRSSKMPEPCRWLNALSEEKCATSQGLDAKPEAEREMSDESSAKGIDGDDVTSSSSSNVDYTSEEISSDDEDGSSSPKSGTSSSTEEDDSSEEDERVQNLHLPDKPPISVPDPASDLSTRLSSFLSALQKANADLQDPSDILAKRVDEVADDEEHYIEMDLGLGVLKEKRAGTVQADGVKLTDDYSSSNDEDFDSDSVEGRHTVDERNVKRTPLVDLMGGKLPSNEKPSIQEMPGS